MEKNKRSMSNVIVIIIVLAILIGIVAWYLMRPSEDSSNNNLDSLVIANYPITFEKNTTTYTINVDEDVDSLEVKAIPEDNAAKVVITGNTNITTGTNEIKITVTASDGTSKIYTVHVNKKNNNDIIDDNMNDNTIDNNNNTNLDKDSNNDTTTNDLNNNNTDIDNKTKSIIHE